MATSRHGSAGAAVATEARTNGTADHRAESRGGPRERLGSALERLGEGLIGDSEPELAWDQQAHCRASDPALFFGPNRFEPKRERLARESEAKAICAGCPCLLACREHAVQTGELYGVWGGMGETDRREMMVRRGIIATAV